MSSRSSLRSVGRRTLLIALLLALLVTVVAISASGASNNPSAAGAPAAQQAAGGPVELNGTARAGDLVRVYEGTTLLGETTVGADGKWGLSVTPSAGTHAVRVQIGPAAGPAIAPPSPEQPVAPGQQAPATPEEPNLEGVTVTVNVVANGQTLSVTVLVKAPTAEVSIFVSVPLGPDEEGDGEPTGGFTYTVRWGDTLGNIAAHYGWTAAYLARVNNLRNPNLIFPGQKLWIPGHRPSAL